MKFLRNLLLRVIAASALLTLVTSSSFAIMRSAEEMPPIDTRLYTEVAAALRPPLLIGPIMNIRGLEMPADFSDDDWSVIIVRIENSNCLGEKCLTLFLTRQDNAIELVAMGQLPVKMAPFDRFPRACDSCGRMFGFLFEDSKRSHTSVGVGAGYASVGIQD
jgi:hypothetical protein